MPEVSISEVGPRDGLQSVARVMATADKLRWIDALHAAGAHELTIPLSASAAHSLANVRRTREQMIDELRAIVALRNEQAPAVRIEVGMSTAFGCAIQGAVAEDDVLPMAAQAVAAGVDAAGLPKGFVHAGARA
jgi:hydroxymethylglutaryl-CoA lyase